MGLEGNSTSTGALKECLRAGRKLLFAAVWDKREDESSGARGLVLRSRNRPDIELCALRNMRDLLFCIIDVVESSFVWSEDKRAL